MIRIKKERNINYDNQIDIDICLSSELSANEYNRVMRSVSIIYGIINPYLEEVKSTLKQK